MRNAPLVTDTMDRMTIDELVMKMLDQHRESYAYHLVKELDVSSEKEHVLLYANSLLERNPDQDVYGIRTILENADVKAYEKKLEKARGTALYETARTELKMAQDDIFRNDVLAAYEQEVQPGIQRYGSYDKELQKLTKKFIHALSDGEVETFVELYGEFRKASVEDRKYLLTAADPRYAELIQEIDVFEQDYGDMIDRDLVNVRENVHKDLFEEPLDREADVLKREEYGALFPYLHVAKTLYTFMDAGNPDSYSG